MFKDEVANICFQCKVKDDIFICLNIVSESKQIFYKLFFFLQLYVTTKQPHPNVAPVNMDSEVYFSNPDLLINAKSHQSLDFIHRVFSFPT